jgi:hypothetical protein
MPSLDALFRLRRCGYCLFLLTLAMPAQAADWWFVSWERQVNLDAILYVDKSSLERQGAQGKLAARAWVIHRADQAGPEGSFRSEKLRVSMDCEHQELLMGKTDRYSGYGALLRPAPGAAANPATMTPPSLLETLKTFICTGGKQPFRIIPVYDPAKDSEQRFWLKDQESKSSPGK